MADGNGIKSLGRRWLRVLSAGKTLHAMQPSDRNERRQLRKRVTRRGNGRRR